MIGNRESGKAEDKEDQAKLASVFCFGLSRIPIPNSRFPISDFRFFRHK